MGGCVDFLFTSAGFLLSQKKERVSVSSYFFTILRFKHIEAKLIITKIYCVIKI